MSIPYTPQFITKLLRDMSDARLREITFQDFQRWPVAHVTPGAVISELINNERARRDRHGQQR